jgi:hypothetical protein
MKKNRVIEFESKERILEKAKKYVESIESFLEESDQAVPLLLRAMKHADREFKLKAKVTAVTCFERNFVNQFSLSPFAVSLVEG